MLYNTPPKSAFLESKVGRGGESGGWLPKLRGGSGAETGVLLGALLSNPSGTRLESPALGTRLVLHFILASSGAEIDIETESVHEAGGRQETGALYWTQLNKCR